VKIRRKLLIIVAITLLAALAVAAFLILSFQHVQRDIALNRRIDVLMRSVFELRLLTSDYLTYGVDRALQQWEVKYTEIGHTLQRFEPLDMEQATILERMRNGHSTLGRQFANLRETDPAREEARSAMMTRMDVGLLAMIGDANRLRDDLYHVLLRDQQRAAAGVMVASVGMVLLVSLTVLVVNRGVLRPLVRLEEGTRQIAQGRLNHRIGLNAYDEVGDFAQAFDRMAERLSRTTASRDELAREVREREAAERRLRTTLKELARSNEELEQFAYVASHDLQEPLRKIVAFGGLLDKECREALPDEGRDYIERMTGAAGRMQQLINDLLALSRVATRAHPFEPVDLNGALREVLSDLESRIDASGARVETEELPTLDADPTQMRQLLQNLVGNALKFHKENEAAEVRVLAAWDGNGGDVASREPAPEGMCRIVVADNGIGFDAKYAERIFGIFQRLHGRLAYSGSGIGLAVCRKIAERHGGTIEARGEPGAGARFVVTLPLRQEARGGDEGGGGGGGTP